MAAISNSALKAMLSAEKQSALSSTQADKLSAERAQAMDYYNGIMTDMPSLPGRSRAVSSDVSDTVEGLMPSLMEIFCGGDEVVRFEPVGPEDVKAAEQETDYCNTVFMNQNPGFLVLYSFIKDALISKTGIVKIYWKTEDIEDRQTYLDQPEDVYMMLISDPDVEVVEHTAHQGEEDGGKASNQSY